MSPSHPRKTTGAALLLVATLCGAADTTPVPNDVLRQIGQFAPPQTTNLAEIGGVTDNVDYTQAAPVEMRDGTLLNADVLVPRTAGKKAAILIKMPYVAMSTMQRHPLMTRLLKEGYALVFVTDRGTIWSEGQYHWLKGSKNDFADSITWIAKQPWSNGRVGTWGCSSGGENQLSLTTLNHPAHKAAIIMGAATGYGRLPGFSDRGVFYTGGIPMLDWAWWYRNQSFYAHPVMPHDASQSDRTQIAQNFSAQAFRAVSQSQDLDWATHLPSQDLLRSVDAPDSEFNKLIQMAPNDPRWSEYDFLNEGDTTKVPSLHVDSWYDSIESWGTIKGYEYLSKNSPNQYLIMGPTEHCAQGSETANTVVNERPIGDARFNYDDQVMAFLDHFLTDKGAASPLNTPRVQYHVLGGEKWLKADQWPPRSEPRKLYLHSEGRANSSAGDGLLSWAAPGATEQSDRYAYDPMNPVPSHGGGCCTGAALEQSSVEMRSDVLVYSTARLEAPVEIAGDVIGTIYLSSSTRDTDLMLKLVDVYPDGKAYNVQDTGLRLRYRDGIDSPKKMEPNKVYKVTVGGIVTASRFGAGHRIRLDVTSSNFPEYERNMNTGGRNYDESTGTRATVTILHTAEYPSHLLFPVVK